MSKSRSGKRNNSPVETPKMHSAKMEIGQVIVRAFTPHRFGEPLFYTAEQILVEIYPVIEKHFGSPLPQAEDLSAINEETQKNLENVVLVERPITRRRIRNVRDWVAKNWFWKPRQMAEFLNISRPQLINIEAGRRTIDEEFVRRFRRLERHIAAWQAEQGMRARDFCIVESKQRLPRRLYITHPIVRCSRCGKHFMQVNRRNKRCHTPECDARKTRKKKQGRA